MHSHSHTLTHSHTHNLPHPLSCSLCAPNQAILCSSMDSWTFYSRRPLRVLCTCQATHSTMAMRAGCVVRVTLQASTTQSTLSALRITDRRSCATPFSPTRSIVVMATRDCKMLPDLVEYQREAHLCVCVCVCVCVCARARARVRAHAQPFANVHTQPFSCWHRYSNSCHPGNVNTKFLSNALQSNHWLVDYVDTVEQKLQPALCVTPSLRILLAALMRSVTIWMHASRFTLA
jgi:hypothetical protein